MPQAIAITDGGEERDQCTGERPEAAASAEDGETQHGFSPPGGRVVRRPRRRWERRACRPRRPSASRMTRSAYAAAAGSWVTITTVSTVLVDDLAQEREHLASGASVERSGRLIGEHDLGPGDERPRDRDPLLLTAGELRGAMAQALLKPDACRNVADRRARQPAAVKAQREGDVLGDRERGQQIERLEDEADPLAPQNRQPRSLSRARSVSPSATVPAVGRSSPAATFRNVLLPEPDGPMTAVNDPAASPMLTRQARRPRPRRGRRPCGRRAGRRPVDATAVFGDESCGSEHEAAPWSCHKPTVRPRARHRREASFGLVPADDSCSYLK